MTAASGARPEIVLIVAAAENGVIGNRGALPWQIKSDLRRFKSLTLDKPVVMGRKTFLSIGRALPRRTNIVLTRDEYFCAPGAVTTVSLSNALSIARGDALRRFATEIAVIGGAEIYAQTLDLAQRIELTLVHARPDGDARFAVLDPATWEQTAREFHLAGEGDSADASYLTYQRRTGQ